MDLLPSDEQQEIAAAAAAFLAKELPIDGVRARRHEKRAVDPEVWARCANLGWFGVGVGEANGGVGYGLVEEAILFREIGRGLAPGPFLATSLAVRAALQTGRIDLAGALMAGDCFAALGLPRDPDAAVEDPLYGAFDLIDDEGASVLLVAGPGGSALVDVSALGPVKRLVALDPASRLGRIDLTGAPATVLPHADAGALFERGTVLAAAILAGTAEAVRDQAAEHARTRVQFGRPIGVHQAIKHRCAEMALRCEAATSQVFFAAAAIDGDRADTGFQASSAKIVATNAAVDNARDNIQIHGGQGYTFGNDANLHLKHAHAVAATMAPLRWHLAHLLDLVPAE
ncbi:acyl-CoA/acyl-ACP dehydrogenase [Acidiferrimicrobium sp. IK]|uniref:acyl-CoA dehydrogenase family protein n=1 Tax=Acidiferrimicrobium sp. IK TaxID=2871700 RepID=UPI0021CB3DBD|nr:acyl-CoA dehydrogenase family protein [Acidiferrimicrobium sp. IK]MCU4183452.1 acyl-CoA/acyl-ACP dehydrogenase [Acidiferrimicrobium sp. IK]